MSDPSDEPVFAVVKGSPTDEEVAALVAVLTLIGRRSEPAPAEHPSGWSAYWRTVKAPIIPGPDAWRMSARP
jgi:acyl-CoA carboxylase epsilon subunit